MFPSFTFFEVSAAVGGNSADTNGTNGYAAAAESSATAAGLSSALAVVAPASEFGSVAWEEVSSGAASPYARALYDHDDLIPGNHRPVELLADTKDDELPTGSWL